MKKQLLIGITAALLLVGCGSGAFTTPSTAELITPLHYELDTWGANSEVYEFTTQMRGSGITRQHCVVFITDSLAATAMQCADMIIE